MNRIKTLITEARKFLVALTGLATTAIADGLVPSGDIKYVTLAISALTALAVYLTPNKPAA